ncbi:ZFP59 protein, partial [Polypterus senegalus]|nr:ZFP59 protein [Polypterus senegalus]
MMQCEHCQKCFKTTRVLKKHLQTHSIHTFSCTFCNKDFTVEMDLLNHVQIHSTQTFISIQHLLKNLHALEYLKAHLNTHSTEQAHSTQDFHCTICSKMFRLQRYLNVHLKSHPTERIMQCEHCEQCFKTTHALKKHLKNYSNSFQCQLANPMHSHRIQFSAAFQEDTAIPVQEHNIGLPTALCTSCNALNKQPLWHHVHVLTLTTNMRALLEEQHFAKWPLDVGDGKNGTPMTLPSHCFPFISDPVQQLYGDIDFSTVTLEQLST